LLRYATKSSPPKTTKENPMQQSIAHDLGQDRAIQVVKIAFESYKKQYPEYQPLIQWINESHAEITFKTPLANLKGKMAVLGSAINLDIDVPFLLLPFKKQALDVIKKEITLWVKKAKSGEVC
jgi:hypothetical protein